MPPFELDPMVFHHGKKPLVLDVPQRTIFSGLDEEPEMIEQLAETNI